MFVDRVHRTTLAVAGFMSLVGCAATAVTPTAATTATAPRSPSELEALIAEHDRAWNAHDPDALAALFVADGSLITPAGEQVQGRPALRALFASPGPTKQTRSRCQLDGVRFLAHDLALIDVTQTLSSPSADMDGKRARLVAVARQEGGQWRFVAARPFVLGAAQ